MKIALFHEVISGGARRGANEFAKSLRNQGHIVDLYLVDKNVDQRETKYYNTVFLYTFIPKVWHGRNWKVKLYKDTIELFKLYILHKMIAKDITAKQYDFAFIHPSQYTQAPFLLRFLNIPKVYYCQEPLRMIYEIEMDNTEKLGIFKKKYERITRKIRKEIDRKNVLCADITLANSSFTKENIFKAYGITATVCHMGVDKEKFYPLKVKKDIDVLFIGSKDPIDGFDLFEKVRKELKKQYTVEYLLRGKKWLSDDRELNRYYNRAKTVICFGKKEPFGLIPLEAMAAGSVVISLDEGGYKDSVMQEKTGIRVKEDPKEIAWEIENLLKDTKRLTKYSENAKNIVENEWSWEKAAQSVIDIFRVWQKKH